MVGAPDLAEQDCRINYVEFPVTDIPRAKAFYGAVFGWTFTDFGPQYCEFSDGGMKGGFDGTGAAPRAPEGGPLVVLYGNDLEAVMGRVTAAGGTITQPIFAFPGGRRFHFKDPEGHELAVWCAGR